MSEPAKLTTDQIKRQLWSLTETNGFVAKDYTGLGPDEEPVITVLKAADIFDFIAYAAREGRKVAIYGIGPCVIDWSS